MCHFEPSVTASRILVKCVLSYYIQNIQITPLVARWRLPTKKLLQLVQLSVLKDSARKEGVLIFIAQKTDYSLNDLLKY